MLGPVLIQDVVCAVCGADDTCSVLFHDELSLRSRSRTRWRIVRCRNCGLVYVNPRARQDPEAGYTDDEYGFARSHLADLGTDGRPHALRVLDDLGREPPGRLLDVGCATGEFLLEARRRGWDTFGVEMSPYAAAVARRRGLDVRVGSLSDARLPPGGFDAVTLLDVIEHLRDPKAELREIHRLMKAGGRLIVETPNWRSIYRVLLRGRWAALQPRLHLLYFDAWTLGRLLQSSGFEVGSVRTEIVSLASAEASRRGLGLPWVKGVARDLVVRWRLGRPPGRIDDLLLRVGPAARVEKGRGSFKRMSMGAEDDAVDERGRQGTGAGALLRAVNWPTDRLFTHLGRGEQLRVTALVR